MIFIRCSLDPNKIRPGESTSYAYLCIFIVGLGLHLNSKSTAIHGVSSSGHFKNRFTDLRLGNKACVTMVIKFDDDDEAFRLKLMLDI